MGDLQKLFAQLKAVGAHDLAADFAAPLQTAITHSMANGFNPAAIAAQAGVVGTQLLQSENQVLIDEGQALLAWSFDELGKVVSKFTASPVPGVSPAK